MAYRILYNVTILIDHSRHDKWLQWMREKHIPEVMATGMFDSYKLTRILGADETQGVNYAVQYVSPDMESFLHYRDHFSANLQKNHKDQFGDHYVAFRTVMEIVGEGWTRVYWLLHQFHLVAFYPN